MEEVLRSTWRDDLEVVASARVLQWLIETGEEPFYAPVYDRLDFLFDRYDIGSETKLVIHCWVERKNGQKEKLSFYIAMPFQQISVAFWEECDWEKMQVHQIAGPNDSIEWTNKQLRQLADPNYIELRSARPAVVLHIEMLAEDGKCYGKIDPAATDWAWLGAVVDEGFDPNAPCGPTYWRVTESQHYAVFRRPDTGELGLLISARKGDAAMTKIVGDTYAEVCETAAAHMIGIL